MSELHGDARHRTCGSEPDLRAAGLNRAALMGCGVVLAAGAVLSGGWVPLAVFGLTWLAIAPLLRRNHPHDRLGPANVVTLQRAALTCALIGPLIAGQPGGWAVAAVAMLALVLDGVDGWLARRSGLTSAFGARFDVEVDTAMALVLALHAWQGAAAGAAVLVIVLIRYVFVMASCVWPWLSAPLPPRFSRKAICVLELAALVLLQLPILPGVVAAVLVWTTLAALLWSFGIDVIWLRTRRG